MFPFLDKLMNRYLTWGLVAAAVLAGLAMRTYHVGSSGFFFYDEGLYLNHNLLALEMIRLNPPQGWDNNWHAFLFYLKMAMGSGKALWFFIMDSRFFFNGNMNWPYAKYAACFFGVLLMPLVYVFSKRFYRSKDVAMASLFLIALLPGAVFYSRLALQEALSMVLVLGGFYLYLFPRKFGPRTLLAGMLMAAGFFSNYRLLMLPALVFSAEAWIAFCLKEKFDVRKFVWFSLAFGVCVLGFGSILDAANLKVVFAWVFHQGDMAPAQFAWINFLSYPYYFFRLETFFFAGLFFSGGAWLWKRGERLMLLPVVLVIVQMLVFSMPSEKGARYIAVVLPFAVMTVAYVLVIALRELKGKLLVAVLCTAGIMVLMMLGKSFQLSQAASAHQDAVAYLEAKGRDVKFVSSQEQVDLLYVHNRQAVKPVPQQFDKLAGMFEKGYRYMLLDPQAYVGLSNERKFNTVLKDYIGFIDGKMQPVKVFPHMNEAFLERFVFEHSENLADSIKFMAEKDLKKAQSLRIYDLAPAVPVMESIVGRLRPGK